MTHENDMTHPIENREPTDPQPKPAQRSRRGLFKAGAMLIPTLVTLRAQPAWANCKVNHTCGGYGGSGL